MIITFITALILSSIMILLNSTISYKSHSDREKLSPFECGFNPQFFSRSPFSTQFFLIAIIFLIFDVEITLIMPIPMMFLNTQINTWIWLSMFFIIMLIMGLFHEWNQGALFWHK